MQWTHGDMLTQKRTAVAQHAGKNFNPTFIIDAKAHTYVSINRLK